MCEALSHMRRSLGILPSLARTFRGAFAGVLAAALLVSCLPPLFDAIVTAHVSDTAPPTITVTSPQDGSPYSSAIEITGSVKDLADAAGASGKVASLRYEVLASSSSGSIPVAADGSFAVTFLSTSLHGAITIRLTATDWNQNVTQATFGMIDSGNGIPGFTASAPDVGGSVTLTWPPVPLVDHYELYYETSDTLPSEQFSHSVSPVISGYTMGSLDNGKVHAFLLKSVPQAGSGAAENWSAVQKVIPLSKAQLVPRVEAGHSFLRVSWTAVPGAASYEVWKGLSESEGSFVNVSGTIQGTSFVDEAVTSGITYYYAIKPAQYSQVKSWSTPATPDPFPLGSRREIASVSTSSWISSFASSADGRYLYTADGIEGLIVFDVSSPGAPVRRGTLASPTQAAWAGSPEPGTVVMPYRSCALGPSGYLVAVAGTYYGGDNESYGRVSVIDVSNPDAPAEVSGMTLGTSLVNDLQATSMAVAGSRVFVEEYSDNTAARLEVYDINPSSGALAYKSFTTATGGRTGVTEQVAASGNLLYQATYDGFQIYAVDPGSGALSLQKSLFTGASDNNIAVAFFVSGASSYVLLGNNYGFHVIDVTTPATASVKTTVNPGTAVDIRVADKRAYLSTTGKGLLIYDVTNPLAPALTGSYHVVTNTACSLPLGSKVFLGPYEPMRGFKVLDALLPRLALHGAAPGSNYLAHVAVRGRYAYATSQYSIDVYDLGGAVWPVKVATIDAQPGGYAIGIAISGNLLVTGSTAVSIYDLTDPIAPALKASVPMPYFLVDVKVAGSLIFAAIRDFGLKIIDISTPTAPKELGALPIAGGWVSSVAVSGTTVLLTHAYKDIAVVDVSDPLAPRLLKDYTPLYHGPGGSQNWGYGIETAGSFAYVVEGDGGLIIVDISTPSLPIERGHVSPASTMQGYYNVAIQGEFAYVSRDSKGVSIISIADPDNPVLVSTLGPLQSPEEYPREIVVSGSTLVTVSPGGGTSYQGLLAYDTK